MSLLRTLSFLTFLGVTAVTGAVRAQADDATRAAARTLGYEGISDFQAGKFPSAADKLDRAYQALRVPSLGLWSARALEKNGKLVAAAERYLEVQRLDPGTGDVAVQKAAQADAKTEHAALEPRIPSIVIELEGASANEVKVTANGVEVPSSLIGIKRPVDPGTVILEAQHGARTAREEATLGEGETKTIVLRFSASTTPTVVGPVVTTEQPKPVTDDQAAKPAASGSGLRTVGFVTLAVGGAAVVAGAVTGGLAMAKRGSIDGCEGNRCPPSARASVGEYNDLRTISSVCFIGGGVLAATGLVLVFTAPKSAKPAAAKSEPSLRLAPFVGVGTAGLLLEGRR